MWRTGAFSVAALLLVAAQARAQDAGVIRGYVTMIDVSSAKSTLTLWIALEKGVKGNQEAAIDFADPLFAHKLALARDALRAQLPVKIQLDTKGAVSRFALRVYPSALQK